jgi:hypothetical protein
MRDEHSGWEEEKHKREISEMAGTGRVVLSDVGKLSGEVMKTQAFALETRVNDETASCRVIIKDP